MKKLLLLSLFCSLALSVQAKETYWTFTDDQEPVTIPDECDARFDEVRGGVFMPSMDEIYHYGNIFLANQSPEIQRQAPYCLLLAALNGNVDAQFKMAQLYNKGKILPQDDLSAYKWAFIAALNGNKEAEKYALNLEQFLETSDLYKTNEVIQSTRMYIRENEQKHLDAMKAQLKEKEPPASSSKSAAASTPSPQDVHAPMPTSLTNIFSEKDHF